MKIEVFIKIIKINSCESKSKTGHNLSIYDCIVGDDTGIIDLRLVG